MNKYIDHTLLKAVATEKDILQLCDEARQYQFMSVCVHPSYVILVKELLKGTDVLVCTVIGFPLGANSMEAKWAETIDAINNGADEIDMVINIGKAKDQDFDYITEEIQGVVAAASQRLVKVIIETCYLTKEEIVKACQSATIAGAHFVKTSTGFGPSGATLEDVRLMRESIPSEMSVKASGGIRSYEDFIQYIKAGANRIGTSSGVAIMNHSESKEAY